MRQSLLLFVGIVAITYFEFIYYPGHTYLQGESQNLVAAMERLNAPGFLSRDLVATNPNLTYTIYDEVTLFLSRVSGHGFEWVLAAQQAAFRFVALLGMVLLGGGCGLKALPALGISALINAGIQLPGIHLALSDPEPTPFAFALSLTLLAFGLLAQSKPLLAGLFGGIALVYQPSIASVFWLSVVAGFVLNRALRPVLRPTLPAFVVFSLLLANAAQLQPGLGEAHIFFERISESWINLQLARTPELWISAWSFWSLVFYVGIGLGAVLALRQVWPGLAAAPRWVLLTLMISGLVSLPVVLLGQFFRLAVVGELEPARTLALTVVCTLILCTAAGLQLWQQRRLQASSSWIALVLAIFLMLWLRAPSKANKRETESVKQMAQWAESNTWGGSMFLFPDAGESTVPGEFRGRSVRAVYVDWTGGALTSRFPAFASEWARRWHETAGNSFSVSRLKALLNLPVEYVVLKNQNALQEIKPEFSTSEFVIYDAHVLQSRALAFQTVP